MHKNAGFMLITLLLITVPALANAWTLTVKVAGGDRYTVDSSLNGNFVEVANGTAINKSYSANYGQNNALQSGTTILYPKSTAETRVTIKTLGTQQYSYRQDNAALNTVIGTPTSIVFPVNTTGNHTVVVSYKAAELTGFSIDQKDGGMIYVQMPNNTWASEGKTGLKAGTVLPVTIAADGNHKIVNYTINGTSSAAGVTGAAGQVLSGLFLSANEGASVTATFATAAKITATLAAPTDGVTGRPVNCSVTASSNVAGLTYSFSVSPDVVTKSTVGQQFSFTPVAKGNYLVTATVTAPVGTENKGARSTSVTATIAVAEAEVVANSQCTSCHATQSPNIVASYSNIHQCAVCHTDKPHSAGVNSRTVDKATFMTLTTNVLPGEGLVAKNVFFCSACHASHLQAGGDSCIGCHSKDGAEDVHSIAIANNKHKGGKAAPAAGAVNVGDSITQYYTQGATCQDCHNASNSELKGFAEGGHGRVSGDPLNPFAHYDWSARVNNGTRQNGNCDRCHTAVGFLKFAGQDDELQARLALQPGQPNNVLVCVACHKSIDTGELRADARPAGNNGDGSGAGLPLTSGYFALFSSASNAISEGNTKIQVEFPGMKNSSICVPCHAGRSTDKVFVETITAANLAHKNYSTISTSYYQHAKNIGQTFIGKGGYEFDQTLRALTDAKTDEQQPRAGRGNPVDGWGNTYWQGPATGKSNFGVSLASLFGGDVKVSDLKSVSYYTYNGTASIEDSWALTIYTKKQPGDTTWYHSRLHNNYRQHGGDARQNKWNLWSTDDATAPMTFQKNIKDDTEENVFVGPVMDIDAVRQGYGPEVIQYITLQTMNTTGYDGWVDGLTVTLNDGRTARVDFADRNEFRSYNAKLSTIGASPHAQVEMGDGTERGPCVGCHYTKAGSSHSLEVDAEEASATCTTCHTDAAPDLAGAKRKFEAGLAALTALAHQKLDPLRVDASKPLETERVNVRFGRFGKAAGVAADAATATKAYGAWYNWQTLSIYDNAGWVHNPAYARQLLNETIDFLDNGAIDGTAVAAINRLVDSGELSAAQGADAVSFMTRE